MAATGYTSTTGDARKVDVAGDTMTGELTLPDSSPDQALNAASKGYVDTEVTEHAGATDPHGDRAYTDTVAAAKAALAHAAQHTAGGGDPVTLTQAQITGLTAALAALAPLAGATFTGAVTVDDANFSVLGTNKGYRFRPLGSRLDCEATGSDWILSVFAGTNFDGTQRTYLRLESGVTLAHACGTWIFADTADSAAVHTLDGTGNKLGFHGATSVAQQTVTGSRGDGTALADLLTKLANVGLIVDGSSA
ncbi:hypothetical protein [Streptomyces sp. NBC_01614]|uniref:hypothetical protein n=1 Tax=Streptomyces sp. NBC_01614 TaxID=2975897 RepID=UPI00386C22FD